MRGEQTGQREGIARHFDGAGSAAYSRRREWARRASVNADRSATTTCFTPKWTRRR